MNAPMPMVQAGASREVVTGLIKVPSRSLRIATVSPILWVKPCPLVAILGRGEQGAAEQHQAVG